MALNYFAFFLISFVPLIMAYLWYRPGSFMVKWLGENEISTKNKLTPAKGFFAFVLSLGLVYGYMNMIIHQLGFYELFFTDIMMGSKEAEQITATFLSKYGQKHRHFGHGVLHGAINAFLFALPMIGYFAIMGEKKRKFVGFHFSYWLLMSMLIGGLISEFV